MALDFVRLDDKGRAFLGAVVVPGAAYAVEKSGAGEIILTPVDEKEEQ